MLSASIRSERMFCCFLSKRPNYIQTSKFIESRVIESPDFQSSSCCNSLCRNSADYNVSDLIFYSPNSQLLSHLNSCPQNEYFLPQYSYKEQGYMKIQSHIELKYKSPAGSRDQINSNSSKSEQTRTRSDFLRVALDGSYPSETDILKLKRAPRNSRPCGVSSNSTSLMQHRIINEDPLATLPILPPNLPPNMLQPSTSGNADTTNKQTNNKDKRPSPNQLQELIHRLESEVQLWV